MNAAISVMKSVAPVARRLDVIAVQTVELSVEMDLVELVDEDHGRIAVDRNAASAAGDDDRVCSDVALVGSDARDSAVLDIDAGDLGRDDRRAVRRERACCRDPR